MKLYFVRHGQSEANVMRIISNRNLAHPLTDVGREQAAHLARSLAAIPLTAIYSSPVLRARQTAEIVSELLHLPVEISDALREPDCGIIEGRSDEAAWAEHARVWDAWDEQRCDERVEGGESFNDVRARFKPFIDRLSIEHDAADQLLLISHGQLLMTMLPLLLANAAQIFAEPRSLPNTGLIVVERQIAGWMCVEWCGTVFRGE